MTLWNRLRFRISRRSLERDLEEEMRAHREMLQQQLIGEGMSAEEARYAALPLRQLRQYRRTKQG
jgi:hypothetical protein